MENIEAEEQRLKMINENLKLQLALIEEKRKDGIIANNHKVAQGDIKNQWKMFFKNNISRTTLSFMLGYGLLIFLLLVVEKYDTEAGMFIGIVMAGYSTLAAMFLGMKNWNKNIKVRENFNKLHIYDNQKSAPPRPFTPPSPSSPDNKIMP